MNHDWDSVIDRRSSESAKWHTYAEDVLPLWVADLDFPSPEPVVRALRQRVDHRVFGYGTEPAELRSLVVAHLEQSYRWCVEPQDIIFLPGVLSGFNVATRAVTTPGDGVLVHTPIYFPILETPKLASCTLDEMELTRRPDGSYSVNFEQFDATITPRSRIFILCNPHNPIGRVYRRDELERMAEICLRRGVIICSDEIHCDLVFSGHRHVPIATLGPEVAQRTITLMAPSKTYNLAGLHFSFAVVQNPELRNRMLRIGAGIVPQAPGVLSRSAALAAYQHGKPWLDDLLRYLEANRDYLAEALSAEESRIRVCRPEGTYLAWLDCRQAGIPGNPYKYFLEEARVALSDGVTFGRGGEGFVRLNFGCPRSTLAEALQRMKLSLSALASDEASR